MSAEAHVVHHGGPEPHGVSGDHVGIKVLDEHVVGFQHDVHDHYGVHPPDGVQGHHGESHVPLQLWPWAVRTCCCH